MSFCDRCAISYTDARTHGVWALQHTCAISNTQACVRVNDSTCMMYWSSNTTSYMCYHLHWCTHTHTTSYMCYRLHWRTHTHTTSYMCCHFQWRTHKYTTSYLCYRLHWHMRTYTTSYMCYHLHWRTHTYTTSYLCYRLHWTCSHTQHYICAIIYTDARTHTPPRHVRVGVLFWWLTLSDARTPWFTSCVT